MKDPYRTDDERWDYATGSYGSAQGQTFRDRWNSLKADPSADGWDWINFARWVIQTVGAFLGFAAATLALAGLLVYVGWRDYVVGHATMQEFPWLIALLFIVCLVASLFAWIRVRELW